MIHGERNVPVDEHFTVYDSTGGFIIGLDCTTECTVHVYDPNGIEVTSSVNGSYTELGDGNYKYTFVPNLNGVWYVIVTHPVYFPWGKTDDVKVDEGSQTEIYEAVIRTLGLTHENIYIDNPTYGDEGSLISARLRIYDSGTNVGTNNGVIETYLISADEMACGKFSYWSQVKI